MIAGIIALMALSLAVFAVPLRRKWSVAIAVVGLGAVLGSVAAFRALAGTGAGLLDAGSNIVWGVQYGAVDMLSAVFLIVISLCAVSVTIYARGYLESYLQSKAPVQISLHYFALLVMYLSMLLVVTFRDGFGFLFSWELMTLASFVLILFDAEKREVRRAALNYLVLMHIGFIFLLVGFVKLYAAGLPVSFDSLPAYYGSGAGWGLFTVFLIGFGMKAGLFPLHIWLPEAHPAAPSHVSAFMSGVMIKMGVYGMMRVCAPMQEGLYAAGVTLLVCGLATGLWGIVLAALQNDMKKILAYSSIENVGIIFTGLGIGLVGKSQQDSMLALLGIGGALLHTVNHSMFKSLLFLGAGSVYRSLHTTSLDAAGGLGKRMPVTSLLFLTGAAAICALPPLSGFVSEFMIYLGFFDGIASGGPLTLLSLAGLVVTALVGGVAVLVFAKLYGVVFLGQPRSLGAASAQEADRPMIAGMAIPLAGILLVGLFPVLFFGELFRIAGSAFGVGGITELSVLSGGTFAGLTRALWAGVALTLLTAWLRRRVLRRRSVGEGPTWGCGFPAQTARMQYTGESFSEGLQRLTRRMASDVGRTDAIGPDEIFPARHDFDVRHEDRVDLLMTKWWGRFVRRANARFSAIRTGMVNHYILYALLFLALVFLLSLLNLI